MNNITIISEFVVLRDSKYFADMNVCGNNGAQESLPNEMNAISNSVPVEIKVFDADILESEDAVSSGDGRIALNHPNLSNVSCSQSIALTINDSPSQEDVDESQDPEIELNIPLWLVLQTLLVFFIHT